MGAVEWISLILFRVLVEKGWARQRHGQRESRHGDTSHSGAHEGDGGHGAVMLILIISRSVLFFLFSQDAAVGDTHQGPVAAPPLGQASLSPPFSPRRCAPLRPAPPEPPAPTSPVFREQLSQHHSFLLISFLPPQQVLPSSPGLGVSIRNF